MNRLFQTALAVVLACLALASPQAHAVSEADLLPVDQAY
jgi:hypothetical protein